MSEPQLNNLALRHCLASLSPLGRCLLSLHVHWERLVWRWLVEGAALGKRAFDILGSLSLIVLFGPLMFLIVLLVKLEDGGPALFQQTRVGKFGLQFKMF